MPRSERATRELEPIRARAKGITVRLNSRWPWTRRAARSELSDLRRQFEDWAQRNGIPLVSKRVEAKKPRNVWLGFPPGGCPDDCPSSMIIDGSECVLVDWDMNAPSGTIYCEFLCDDSPPEEPDGPDEPL